MALDKIQITCWLCFKDIELFLGSLVHVLKILFLMTNQWWRLSPNGPLWPKGMHKDGHLSAITHKRALIGFWSVKLCKDGREKKQNLWNQMDVLLLWGRLITGFFFLSFSYLEQSYSDWAWRLAALLLKHWLRHKLKLRQETWHCTTLYVLYTLVIHASKICGQDEMKRVLRVSVHVCI